MRITKNSGKSNCAPITTSSSNQGVGDVDDESIPDITLGKPLHGLVHVINSDEFNVCSHVVLCSEVYHLLCVLHPSDAAPSQNPPTCCHSQAMVIGDMRTRECGVMASSYP